MYIFFCYQKALSDAIAFLRKTFILKNGGSYYVPSTYTSISDKLDNT